MASSDWTDGTDDIPFGYSSPWENLPGVRTGSELTRGELVADMVRNRMGSWAFVGWFLSFMCIWGLVNVLLGSRALDPFPFILLNLFLSMLAGLQGAILLIAAKRADAIAAEQALSHLTISQQSGEIIRAVRAEQAAIHSLLHEIHKTVHLKENP